MACETCRGLGLVPLKPRKPYAHVEGLGEIQVADLVPGKACPTCRPDQPPELLVSLEEALLKTGEEKHAAWEKNFGWPLVRVETRHCTVHCQLSTAESQKVGLALDAMYGHLQSLTGTLELTPAFRDRCELVALWEKPSWDKGRLVLQQRFPQKANDFQALDAFSGVLMGGLGMFYESPNTNRPPANMAVFTHAQQQVGWMTDWKRPAWLDQGFAAHCEYAVLKNNLCWSRNYNLSQVKTASDWIVETRRLLAANQLRPWAEMFPLMLSDFKEREYVIAFSMVSYLLQLDSHKFVRFTQEVRNNAASDSALETAYEMKVDDLQAGWVKWISGEKPAAPAKGKGKKAEGKKTPPRAVP